MSNIEYWNSVAILPRLFPLDVESWAIRPQEAGTTLAADNNSRVLVFTFAFAGVNNSWLPTVANFGGLNKGVKNSRLTILNELVVEQLTDG